MCPAIARDTLAIHVPFSSKIVQYALENWSDELLQILKDLQEDKSSFEKLGVSYEVKAFYDILVKVRDENQFNYADDKCLELAKAIKELVDDKSQYADWSSRDDIKNQLNMDLTILLYKHGYPPEWDEEIFEQVLEQTENFKKNEDDISSTTFYLNASSINKEDNFLEVAETQPSINNSEENNIN